MVGDGLLGVSDGIVLIFAEGSNVGGAVIGKLVGVSIGDSVVGFRDGTSLGASDGVAEGALEGPALLTTVGTSDGTELLGVMDIDGQFDGLLVGSFTGAIEVGMPDGISTKFEYKLRMLSRRPRKFFDTGR